MRWFMLGLVLVVGCAGQDGAGGEAGTSGADGEEGEAGAGGADGQNGAEGAAGADGQDGAAGATGPTGPAGADANAAYRWLDSTGAEVSPNPELLHHDAAGYAWFIDVETGSYHDYQNYLVYKAVDCSGPAYVYFPPRSMMPFELLEDPGIWYVRPIGLSTEQITAGSIALADGSCSPFATDVPAVLLDDCIPSTPITPPVSPWVGPLYTAP